MAFLNNVTVLNSGSPLALPATGTVTTVETYKGEPGNPTPGHCLDKTLGYSIQLVWTGTPTGNFTLQGSQDNITFTTLTGSTVAAGGGAGSFIIKDSTPYYKYVQVAYTATSGTGSLTAKLYKLSRSGL